MYKQAYNHGRVIALPFPGTQFWTDPIAVVEESGRAERRHNKGSADSDDEWMYEAMQCFTDDEALVLMDAFDTLHVNN